MTDQARVRPERRAQAGEVAHVHLGDLQAPARTGSPCAAIRRPKYPSWGRITCEPAGSVCSSVTLAAIPEAKASAASPPSSGASASSSMRLVRVRLADVGVASDRRARLVARESGGEMDGGGHVAEVRDRPGAGVDRRASRISCVGHPFVDGSAVQISIQMTGWSGERSRTARTGRGRRACRAGSGAAPAGRGGTGCTPSATSTGRVRGARGATNTSAR